jgi:hypothetical protein
MKEPPARQAHQFASNDIARYHALGVAESICNGCHSSFALFEKFFQWVGFCRAFCTNLWIGWQVSCRIHSALL